MTNAVQLPYLDRMATRTKRIEMRADIHSEELIARAAEAEAVSVSAFVLGAAVREADRVLGRSDRTLMSAELFDALVESLDVADAAPRLAAGARSPKRYRRT